MEQRFSNADGIYRVQLKEPEIIYAKLHENVSLKLMPSFLSKLKEKNASKKRDLFSITSESVQLLKNHRSQSELRRKLFVSLYKARC